MTFDFMTKQSNDVSESSDEHTSTDKSFHSWNLQLQQVNFTSPVAEHLQGGPKKVSHYRESSLNSIKNRQPG